MIKQFKTGLLMLLLGALFSLSSCYIDIDDDDDGPFFGSCIEADGPIVTDQISLPNMEGFFLSIPVRLEIRQGNTQEVFITGPSNIIDVIVNDSDFRNGIWEIEVNRDVCDFNGVSIEIILPDLEFAGVSGSGSVINGFILPTNDVELVVSGSGRIDLGIDADDIRVSISGSGSVLLEGTCDELDVNISGSGRINAYPMEARRGDVVITGSGSGQVFVTDDLDVTITGSGTLFFRGDPDLDISITGSGSVIDDN